MKATVLCYNLKGTKEGRQAAMIFGFLGYRVRHVEKKEYLLPVGVLAGMQKEEKVCGEESVPCEGEGFTEAMLVFHPATEDMLDKALFLMRKEKVQIGLKAVLTPTNQEWTSVALYEEIKKEHEYMTEKAKERKEKD